MLTVAMITMNEEKAIGKVIGDIRRHAPHAEIFIVDSSKDRTPEIAASLGARVLRQFPPQGYGPAMERALREAGGDVVITMDCDDTYPAELIPDFERAVVEEGCDLVDGCRLHGKPDAMPWLNYFANAGFALLASVLFLVRLRDLHSGMRAYRKSMIDALELHPKGPALPVELLLKPMRLGYRVKIVDIPYRFRIGISTMRPFESAWWTLRRIVQTRAGA